jgi:hypothetical protein
MNHCSWACVTSLTPITCCVWMCFLYNNGDLSEDTLHKFQTLAIFMCKNPVSFLPLLKALQEKCSTNSFHIYIWKLLSLFIQYLQFPYVCRLREKSEIEFHKLFCHALALFSRQNIFQKKWHVFQWLAVISSITVQKERLSLTDVNISQQDGYSTEDGVKKNQEKSVSSLKILNSSSATCPWILL